jgi:hypothetical protein
MALQRDIAAGTVFMDQWIKCTQVATGKLAGSSQEGAEVVALAAFGGKMREQIIAQVLTLRAKSPLR